MLASYNNLWQFIEQFYLIYFFLFSSTCLDSFYSQRGESIILKSYCVFRHSKDGTSRQTFGKEKHEMFAQP